MSRRIGPAWLLFVAMAAAQEVPSSWCVGSPGRGEQAPSAVLSRAHVERAGWRIADAGTQPVPTPGAMSLDRERLTCRFDRPTLVVVDRARGQFRATLDDRFEINLVPAASAVGSSDADTSAILVPAGLHVVVFHGVDRWRELTRFWGLTFGPILVLVLLLWFAWPVGGGYPHQRRGPKTAWWASLALAVCVIASWWWVTDLPLIAVDHDHIHVFPKLLVGDDPFGPLGFVDGRDRPIADGDVFRPWQYLTHALVTMPSGGSPWWLHLAGILMHAGCAVVMYHLLRRVVPRGAWIGALLGCTLPLPAQSLTWINAHALPQCLLAAFGAWLCAVRYLERGSRFDLCFAPVLLWVSVATKESGLPLAMAMPVVAALLARRLPWKRLGLLVVVAILLLVAWRVARVASGIPFSLETYGMTFDSSLDVLMHALRRLPALFGEAIRTTVMTDVPAASLDATAALASDAASARIAIMRSIAAWLPHAAVWWTLLLAFAFIAIVRGDRVARLALLLGLPLCALMALPDALHHAPTPALIRKVHPLVVPGLALLVACAVHAAAASPRWRIASRILATGSLLVFIPAHAREASTWTSFSQVSTAWVDRVVAIGQSIDERPLTAGTPLGPPALIVVGHPPRLGFDSLIGPTMAGYQQPPLTERPWLADHLQHRGIASASEVVRSWPWELVVIESDGSVAPPSGARVLPPRSPVAPVSIEATGTGFRLLSKTSWRSANAIAMTFDTALPQGASITPERGEAITLSRGRPAGATLRLEFANVGASPLEEGTFNVTFTTDGRVALPTRAELLDDLPEIVWESPDSRTEIAHDAPLPTLRWRLPSGAPDGFRLSFSADGAEFTARVPKIDIRIPASVLTRDDDVWTSTILGANHEAWVRTLENVRKERPDVAAFWIRIRLEAVAGSPSWPLARSRPLLLRIRLKPRRPGRRQ